MLGGYDHPCLPRYVIPIRSQSKPNQEITLVEVIIELSLSKPSGENKKEFLCGEIRYYTTPWPLLGMYGGCPKVIRSEEHTSELQSHSDLVCRLLLEKKQNITATATRVCTESYYF